jgi:hypothetical protein
MEASARALSAKIDAARGVTAAARAAGVPGAARAAELVEQASLEYCMAAGAAGDARGADSVRAAALGDFAARVDALVAAAEAEAREAGVPLRGADKRAGRRADAEALQRALDGYPRGPLSLTREECRYTACACGAAMSVDSSRSELYCGVCGAVQKLEGMAFDASQFYSQEGQKAKSGAFNPNRHFRGWMLRILAKEPDSELGRRGEKNNEFGEETLHQLAGLIEKDQSILLRLLKVEDVRRLLIKIGRTELNKNVPLIIKKLTGRGPPDLSEDLIAKTENMFTKAIEVYEQLRPDGRVNRNYYPYYIRRILELLIPEADFEARRVFWYIYLQSEDTVIADDNTWRRICEHLQKRGHAEFVFRPTDRNLGLKYPPA